MKLEQLHPALKELLCVHEALRKLGFQTDDLFGMHGDNKVFIVIKTQGKEFNIAIGEYKNRSREKWIHDWEQACSLWRNASMREATNLYKKSKIRTKATQLVTSLVSRGINIPKAVN